jgi:hypothetical protein
MRYDRAMKTALAAVCALTLVACAYLAISYVTLKGTADLSPLAWLSMFAMPAALTLAALATGASGLTVKAPLLILGAGNVWLGGWSIQRTLASPHFEGYALVLGAIGITQGVLTIVAFAGRPSAAGL